MVEKTATPKTAANKARKAPAKTANKAPAGDKAPAANKAPARDKTAGIKAPDQGAVSEAAKAAGIVNGQPPVFRGPAEAAESLGGKTWFQILKPARSAAPRPGTLNRGFFDLARRPAGTTAKEVKALGWKVDNFFSFLVEFGFRFGFDFVEYPDPEVKGVQRYALLDKGTGDNFVAKVRANPEKAPGFAANDQTPSDVFPELADK